MGLFFLAQSQAGDERISKDQIARALGPVLFQTQALPTILKLEDQKPLTMRSTIDWDLQKAMEKHFALYKPDYGAFVALDPATGRILALMSYGKEPLIASHLALRATFPSASVFKIVTATAVLDNKELSSNSLITYNGRGHTLYRRQILENAITRFTRTITLREAFGKSINTVFGKLGAFHVGKERMRQFAERFGFNTKITTDLPMQQGRAVLPDDAFGLAESASGFTRENTMSPLQGALIAASVVQDGMMMEPYVVESLTDAQGAVMYRAEPTTIHMVMEPPTAKEVRLLMQETVRRGTSRHAFRGFFGRFPLVDAGGKTGSLMGTDPSGKYDWFVGYAESGSKKIAVAVLTIHGKFWRVKSSYLARLAFESYYKKK